MNLPNPMAQRAEDGAIGSNSSYAHVRLLQTDRSPHDHRILDVSQTLQTRRPIWEWPEIDASTFHLAGIFKSRSTMSC
jgi:hypothetical protein